MPSSYAVDTETLIDQLAVDNERLSKENKRLNEIVDAFVHLAGRVPRKYDIEFSEDLHLTPAQKKEAAEAAIRVIHETSRRQA